MGASQSMKMNKCEICFEQSPIYLPFFTCTHSKKFCSRCIQNCLIVGRRICPICRANFSRHDQFDELIRRSILNDYYSSTKNSLYMIMGYFSIGLLLALIIYPTLAKN